MIEEKMEDMEEILRKYHLDMDADELFLELVETFIEGGQPEVERSYKETHGKLHVEIHGKVVSGTEDEDDCMYVKWIKLGNTVFEIGEHFA